MIQTLNPNPSKTDEIMSRYRPIAPKPQPPPTPAATGGSHGGAVGGPMVPEKLRQSPYFRTIWSHLQARPTRTRKRGRGAAIPTSIFRKQQYQVPQSQPEFKLGRPSFVGLGPPPFPGPAPLNFQFSPFHYHHPNSSVMANENHPITLPLLSCAGGDVRKSIDLNNSTADVEVREKDLVLQLSSPSSSSSSSSCSNGVISPRPVRPVGSTIYIIGPINVDPQAQPPTKARPEDIEAGREAEPLPVVVSDRKNKVRLANSAYKQMVGQPECPWLESMVSSNNKRIGGEVMIHLPDPSRLPVWGNGFSCWVRIEWEIEGKRKWVNAFADTVKLACEEKDYLFSWRFHVTEISA